MAEFRASRPAKAELNIEQLPDFGITIIIPSKMNGGSHRRVSSLSGSRAAIPAASESTRRACGRYWARTREFAPSAPISTSAVAVVPSVKWAVTVPSAAMP